MRAQVNEHKIVTNEDSHRLIIAPRDACMEVSRPHQAHLLHIHGFVLGGLFNQSGWATVQTPTESAISGAMKTMQTLCMGNLITISCDRWSSPAHYLRN